MSQQPEVNVNSMGINRVAFVGGALCCLLGVIIGAFGSHYLASVLQENGRESVYELANRYQFYHGLALLFIALLAVNVKQSLTVPVVLMLIGTVIFCGSLYLLALLNSAFLGAVTPIGGTLLILAWCDLIRRVLVKCE